jgi:translocation and assembly module TamB
VRELRGSARGLALRLAGTARLEPLLPLDARLEWRLEEPALSATGTVRGDLARLAIEQFLRLPDDVRVTATLNDVGGTPRLVAAAAWDDVGFDLPGIGTVHARQGSAALDGTLEEWTATLSAALGGEALPALQGRGSLRSGGENIEIDELRLEGAAGTIAAHGALDISAAERLLELDVTATGVDVSTLRPGLEGRLSARARVEARLPLEARVAIERLEGRLMGRPLDGSGEVGYRDGVLSFNRVTLRAGPNRLQVDGSVGQALSGRFTLDAPELGVLWPDLSGSLAARALLAGTAARPVVNLDARGTALALRETRVEALDLRIEVDRAQHVDARLTARAFHAAGFELGDLDADAEGTLGAHRFAARLTGGLLAVTLESAGSWSAGELRHRVSRASVGHDALGEWRLAGEPALSLGTSAAQVGPHCWEQSPGSLCIGELAWSAQRSRIALRARELPLELLARGLPKDFAVTGRVSAEADLGLTPAGIGGTVAWRQEGTILSYTGGEEPLATPLDVVRLDLDFSPAAATAVAGITGPDGLQLAANARMATPLGESAALDVQVEGRLPDVKPLLALLPGEIDLSELEGGIVLDAGVYGTLQAPEITGVVRFSDGAIALPGLGLKIEAIDVALLGDGSPVLRLQGSAKAGGPLTLAGEVAPFAEGGPTGLVRLRGNRIDVVRLPDRFVQASPDVTLRYEAGALAVSGEVSVPKADIVVRELPETAVSPSPDTVVVDRGASAAETGTTVIGGEIALDLGRDVRLRGFGLDTRLEGGLKLSQAPDGAPRGFGVVRLVEGRFGAYGKELTIERGTLGFAGPLDDPAVDLRASRQVDWEGRRVTAGIIVSGTANRTQSRVYSDPAMSEADALSYLISGRPMQSANSNERSAISGAALALGMQQTSPLTRRLGSAVTLDELGVEGGALEETEIVAGKQIGSDLYVRFAYGLFNRIGTVLARYRIGRNLSIEAASGEDQSLDLIWSVERE